MRCQGKEKAQRGCGRTPVRRDGRGFILEALLEYGVLRDWSSNDYPTQARTVFREANFGKVWERAGLLWPWCPKWWVAFASEHVRADAAWFIELLDMVQLGAASNIYDDLTPAGAEILRIAHRMREGLKVDDLEEATKNAGGKHG